MYNKNCILQGSPLAEKEKVFVNIGNSFASRDPIIITTLLGSCVAVCLFDPVARIGGMNHILLPGKPDMREFNNTARYGVNAMELLITQMMKLGGVRSRMVAKAFGGAHVIRNISPEFGVGDKNAAFVIEFLKNENIKLVSYNLGGRDIRRLYFHTDSGEVFLARRSSKASLDVFSAEQKQLDAVRKKIKKPCGVTIFK